MPRVRPRSNIYALMPILATIIMVGGITLTWMRISEYTGEGKAKPRPPVPGPKVPNVEPLPTAAKTPTTATPAAEPDGFGRVPGKEPDAKAPDEAAPTEKAPAEKAPDDGGVAPPAEKGEAPGPAVAPVEKKGPDAKAKEEDENK